MEEGCNMDNSFSIAECRQHAMAVDGRLHGETSFWEGPYKLDLIDKISDPLLLAYAQYLVCKKQHGRHSSPGIDGMTAHDIIKAGYYKTACILSSMLKSGTYIPAPYLRGYLPKPDGTRRPINIPTYLDRAVQKAISIILNPI